MKNSNGVGVWRPFMGVVVLGGLAIGVSALAAPRGSDPASRGGKDKVGTELTRLVTGDPAQINSVVAGTPPTAVWEVIPGTAKVGAYPASVVIADNKLSADAGGFRMWLDWRAGKWDPNEDGSPVGPGTVQATIDSMGFMSGKGDPLDYAAAVPCTANSTCATAYGESYAPCAPAAVVPRICDRSYVDRGGTRPGDNYCRDFGSGSCNQGSCAVAGVNHSCFGITEEAWPAGLGNGNVMMYLATTVIDVPAGAKGTYTVNLDQDNTFMASGTPQLPDIPTLTERGFIVEIRTGSCCSDLTVTPAACDDNQLKSECVNADGSCAGGRTEPCIWSYDKTCAEGCVECINNAGCDDGDSCTTETCNLALGVCVRGFVAGFDPAKPGGTTCCDGSGANPVITNKDDGDACTVDSCSLANNRGTALHDAAAAGGLSCDDANPCTTDDKCDGVRTEQAGGCNGTDINGFVCGSVADCPDGAQDCIDGLCFCTLIPKVTFELNSPAAKTCDGGFNDGGPCAKDSDCPGGGFCDVFANGANCFDLGSKVSAVLRIASAASAINGGQFNIAYDPSCVKFNSATCLAPYTENLSTSANQSTGKIFIACGVDPFGKIDGPLGNVNIVALNFTMVGECSNCGLSFEDKNPLNNYLVDNEGQAVNIDGQPKELSARGELVLDVPGNLKVNSDCDRPTASVSWAAPNADFSCGDTNLSCRGAHQSGLQYSQAVVNGGGVLPQGLSSFCCYAWAKDKCDQAAGCPGRVNDCPGSPKPDGCWTVEVNDETSLDIHIQLEPPIAAVGELERCIEFCLYGPCTTEPSCFTENVTFGGLFNYVGKAGGKIKVPKGKWGCITAQDQLHSLRSCDNSPDCIDGQLVARFKGDPIYGGNWLIGGNLDGWKKEAPKASLDVIDILDFGQFVSQFQVCYEDRKYDCHEGPHADINGDGCVNAADYNFITRNFLKSSKQCCCGPQAGAEASGLVEVSVDELNQMGLGDLAVADLNGDGLVNADDMDAFTQGVRPVKTNDRKGVKGLRSQR